MTFTIQDLGGKKGGREIKGAPRCKAASKMAACKSLSVAKPPFLAPQAALLQTRKNYVCTRAQLTKPSPNSRILALPTARRLPASISYRRTPVTCGKVSKGGVPPSFTLKDQDGKSVSLSKYKGKPVVLYFYPADETPGCTKQACAFRDSYEKFKKAGAEVIGISGDGPTSHKNFAKKYKLPFTLLSDEGDKVRKQWGVPSDFFGALPGRQTYVIDKNGVVQLVYNNQFQPEKHIDETLKLLQKL